MATICTNKYVGVISHTSDYRYDSYMYVDASYTSSRSGNTMTYNVSYNVRPHSDYGATYMVHRMYGYVYADGVLKHSKMLKNWAGSSTNINDARYYGEFSFTVNTNETSTNISITLDIHGYSSADNYTGTVDRYMDTICSQAYLGQVVPITPSAPSIPSSISIPSAIAPDKTASISWGSSSGGTNGVSGYQWQWSKNGGSSYSTGGNTSSRSASLNLGSNSFVHNSVLRARVRSYSTVNSANYYSGWKTSDSVTVKFVAPSIPRNLTLVYNTEEPIPTAMFTGSWSTPSSTGSNGIGGYEVIWLKNGSNYNNARDVGNVGGITYTLSENYAVGDTISFKVRAYTVGQGTKYYSDYATSGTITIVSDKFIFVSQNGGSFNKYKMYVSINGGSFKEVKKNKFKII